MRNMAGTREPDQAPHTREIPGETVHFAGSFPVRLPWSPPFSQGSLSPKGGSDWAGLADFHFIIL